MLETANQSNFSFQMPSKIKTLYDYFSSYINISEILAPCQYRFMENLSDHQRGQRQTTVAKHRQR